MVLLLGLPCEKMKNGCVLLIISRGQKVSFTISIPSISSADTAINLEVGGSIIFVGVNGPGKTRLAVFIERELGEKAHRISTHRALNLNPDVPKIREGMTLNKLRYGYEGERAR